MKHTYKIKFDAVFSEHRNRIQKFLLENMIDPSTIKRGMSISDITFKYKGTKTELIHFIEKLLSADNSINICYIKKVLF